MLHPSVRLSVRPRPVRPIFSRYKSRKNF